MKITKIQPAVKTVGRYNIFVDGKYSFSLTESQLIEEKLKLDQEINESEIDQLKGESEFGKAYARAQELILRRPRSEKEMRDYARRKKWDDELYNKVVQRLRGKGYLNDKKFAEFWLRARIGSKPISKRKLNAELRQKGIERELINEILLGYSSDEEQDALDRLVEKKRSKYPDEQKLIAYLARQGFSFEAIKMALKKDRSA